MFALHGDGFGESKRKEGRQAVKGEEGGREE